jgi:hypothetical protein
MNIVSPTPPPSPTGKQHITSDEKWVNTLEKVKTYIDENSRRPLQRDETPEGKILCDWINQQIINYDNEFCFEMSPSIRDKWEDLVNDRPYKRYFRSNKDMWENTLVKVKTYMDANSRRPRHSDENPYSKKLAVWIIAQNVRYSLEIYVMKYSSIREMWEEFIFDPKYDECFTRSSEKMVIMLKKIEKYIDGNSRLPTPYDEDPEVEKLGRWIFQQRMNYRYDLGDMTVPVIRAEWDGFVNNSRYKGYFGA